MKKFYTKIQIKFLGDSKETPIEREVDIISREDDFIFCRVEGFDTALKIDEIYNEDGISIKDLLSVVQ